MNIGLKALVATVALAVASIAALAQTPATAGAGTPGIDQRQANQDKRIDQGVASGALTRREARRLEHEQRVIERAEHRAKADGVVTAQERRRLHAMQNRASRDIHRQKHDRQRAARAAGA